MGRSKFPGKPSKSVMKERIRVLYKNENGRSDKDVKKNNGFNSKYNGCCIQTTATESQEQRDIKLNPLTDADSSKKPQSLDDPAGRSVKTIDYENGQYEKQSDVLLGQDEETKVLASGSCAGTSDTSNPSIGITGGTQYPLKDLDKLTKKKTVTFKNVLETSDDTLLIKSIHNPLNKGPLVSIMKKECLASQGYLTRGDVIVRPSRLTEILKNNENIDKTKSLSFRSVQIKRSDLSENAKAHGTQVNQYRSPSKEDKKREFAIKNQNENLEKPEQQSIEDNYNLSLDKWKLQKFRPNSDIFETDDDQIKKECRKWSPKRKDSTSHNKIILRQPRLHFEPQSEILVKGKQNSLNSTNNGNTPINNLCTHSVCGVCNTSVGSKILQNRKYGIIACDACRKFISKITKKTVSSSTNPLTSFKIQCSKRDGECVITSLPKNNVKSFKKIYDERCSACWLRKCIKSFHFPSGHKLRLNAILSENNKSKIDIKSVNKTFDSLHSSSVNTLKYGSESLTQIDYADNGESTSLNWRLTTPPGGITEPVKSHNVDFASVHNISEPVIDNILSDVFANSKQSQNAQPLNHDGFSTSSGKQSKLNSNSNPIKKLEPVLCKSIELQSTNTTPEYPKRQKIDFKGPRVKHVCRSASIALGQQIATFSNEDEKPSKYEQSKSENIPFTNSLLGNIYFSANDQKICSQKSIEDVEMVQNQLQDKEKVLKKGFAIKAVETQKEPSKNPCASSESNELASIKENRPIFFENSNGTNKCQFQKSAQKYGGNKNIFMLANRNVNSLSKMNLIRITKARNCEKKSKMISIDFWDTYVPAEVSQTGFGLILTESAPTCALCFLCGSMDLEYLLFCASCCEPYHSYCIQEEVNSIYAIFKDKIIAGNAENKNNLLNQLNWVCPRCTICYTCNMSSGEKIKCQKCKKNYHSTCMGTSKGLLGADRPLICRSCLKCQTCSTTKVSKYVGNQPICMQCFKLRRLDSRCPLCNNLFDNILDLIILECGICEKLIHVKCEGLTEEQSNLLSNLPENIKFVCKKCSLANDNAKALANEWREAVYEELKAGLLDVLRLLSRSRQANVLKRNVNKICRCGFQQINKNHHILSYENYKHSYIKEGSKSVNNYILNNHIGSSESSKCLCSNVHFPQSKLSHSLSLFDVKKKIINGEYVSLFDFNADMNDVIMPLKNDELILAYKEILSEKFSWFQNETKTCTDALEEDMFESCNYSFQLDDVVTEDQNATTKFPELLGTVLNYLKQETDNRVCIFCLKEGDGGILQESRLLYYGYNLWVHANCAIYSNDVYEEFDGTLQNVQNALNKGRVIKCSVCKWPGATIKCSVKTCSSNYHFQCARKAKCEFLSNKSVYCSTHFSKDTQKDILAKEMFTVFRPLYIESDKCRRKYVEPSKVKFAMGSLSVIQLGTVSPKFSDTSEAIVPINFACTRLYWSCKEPWKIVKYSVRTLIQHGSITFANDIENNFTVDHSNHVNLVETGLSQIASWHNTLTHGENPDATLHHEYGQLGNHRFSTDNDNDTISDACVEEEPQNNSDLLPPEIKDAIFEDLPHDILDGISMLDIFPKLMIYEDLISIEGKPDMLLSEATENCTLQISDDCTSYSSAKKKDTNNKFTCNFVNNIEDTSLPILHSTYPKRELQRSNSEVFLRNFEGYRSQRSSSVTWGCKFDSTRRYFTKGLSDVGLSETRVYHSNCRKAEDEYDDYKFNSKNNSIFDEGKHLTQIKKDNIKLMQLDGTDDTVIGYISTHLPNSASKSPVKCDRCHCTYRSFDSFQRHLVTCEQISTSESETETSSLTPDASHSTIVFQDETLKTNLQLYHNQLPSNQKFPTNISIVSEPNVISPENIIPQTIYATNTTDYEERIYPNINKTGYSNINKNKISINTGYDENNWQNVTSCGINSKCSDKNKNLKCNCTNSNSKANNEQYKVCTKTKQESIGTPETINNKAEYNSQGKQGYLQFLNQQLVLNNQYSQKDQQSQQQQFVVIQQSVGNNQPLFLQQVANQTAIPQNIFPVVLSNNSMQYASIPSSTNPLVQGSILQTDASGNLILSSGLQMLSMPSLQLTSQTSPQLFGTFNQPQPLHIGSNQMLIGGTGPMELMPNANQVLLAAPPVYYGLETIVQNTVMSSQQFVSTAMQGVLSQNASFSATTTQVFQSSKFEPVSDTPSGYVLLNNADGTAILVPQTNLMSGFINTNNVHDYQSNYSQDFGNIPGTHSTTFMQQPQPKNVVPLIPTIADITNITTEAPIHQIQATVNLDTHISSPGKITDKFVPKVDTIISPKNNALHQNLIHNAPICDIKVSDMEETQMVANDYGNHFNVQLICNDSEIYESQNTSANVNNIKLKNGAQVKPKVTQRYIKRSKVSKNTIMSSKAMLKNIVQKEVELNQSKEAILKSLISKSKKEIHHIDAHNVQSLPLLNTVHRKVNSDSQNGPEIIEQKGFDACIETSECYLAPKVSIQNTVQKSNNRSTSESYLINTNKLPPTTTASFGSNFNNVPTNIVPPIFQTHPSNNTPSRPTNRVLPMQSIHKPVDRSKLKTLTIKRSSFRDNLNKLIDTSDMEMKNNSIPKQSVEQNFNIANATDPKDFALKHMIAPENDVSEIKTNSNSITDPLNVLQKLPILDKGVELKLANNSNHTIPLDNGKKYDQNTLNDKGSDNIPSRNPLSVENEKKSVIEVSIDTQLQKPIDEAFVKNDCLEVVKSLESSTADVKCKSPKQLVADQYSSRNTCQKIAICNSKKRPEIDNRKKDSEPHLIYEIQSEDGFSYKSKSAAEVWEKVFEAVQTARRLHGLSSLPIGPFADMCGVQMIGLKTNALKYLIEQLPGTENCTKYTPKYHKSAPSTVGSEYLYQDQEDLPENSYGAVRCEPFAKRSDYDLFSWLASKHRKQPKQIFVQPSDTELIARRCTANLPMAMKYRTLKESCKHNVGVFRSLIHGRGLFCIKDIEAGEMVIEYAGELIRSTLTDKRERFYDSRGIGCYMFKIDDNFVVDATMRGNAARFINHSCEPNCYSKVVDILGHKHIIIFSLRRIVQGEELTYDYKFPFEDVKIPCSCGSKKCRKYLN